MAQVQQGIVFGVMSLLAVSAATQAASLGGMIDEKEDVGGLPTTAGLSTGSGNVSGISGSLGAGMTSAEDFEDMYLVQIVDPANLSIETSTLGWAEFPSRLWLFRANPLFRESAFGLLANEDDPQQQAGSFIGSVSTDGTGVQLTDQDAGYYFVAISPDLRFPRAKTGGGQLEAIFHLAVPTEVSGPDGPAGGDSFEDTGDWVGAGAGGAYQVRTHGLAFAIPPASGPGNDTCQTPKPITSGVPIPFSNVHATTSGVHDPTCPLPRQDVWFSWTADCDGVATFSTCDSTNFDSVIVIWGADCGAPLYGCNDNGNGCLGGTSSISGPVEVGESYFIQVGSPIGLPAGVGWGTLRVDCVPDGGCPGDITGDGSVGIADLLDVIDQWGQNGVPADVNNDGTVNVLDLLIVIDSWGPC
jgi:hypothetical protein